MSHFTVVALVIVSAVSGSPGVRNQPEAASTFKKTFWSRVGTTLLEDKTIQNFTKCALLCLEHSGPETPECSAFRLEPTCKLFTGLIPGVAWVNVRNRMQDIIYRKGNRCPVSEGYAVHSVDGSNFCLKAYWKSTVVYSDARRRCNNDGGNVVDLENRAKYTAIKELFTTLTGSTPKSTYVGAYKTDRVRSESTGLKPTRLQWGWAEPNDLGGREKCVGIGGDMRLNDINCSLRYPFICEIVI